MTVSIDLPADIENELRQAFGDIDRAAKEAVLIEWYRQGRVTHHQLSQALQLSRYETDGLLKRHNVTEDLLTVNEFDQQLRTIDARHAK
jgi:predicted HTH domain antitoxin